MSTHGTFRGFTLIETAVALAILAFTLTIAYQSFGWTLRRSGEQQRRDVAWLTALSLLDQLRRDPTLTTGRRNERSPQGLQWEAVVENYAYPASMTRGTFAPIDVDTPPLLQIRITVRWGDSPVHNIELRSIEFGAARWR